MTTGNTGLILVRDLLAGEALPAGARLSALSEAEGPSRWALGPELELDLPPIGHAFELRLRVHHAGFEQKVDVWLDGAKVGSAELGPQRPQADFRIVLPTDKGAVSLRVRPDRWNENGSLVPGDLRAIALNLGELRLLHAGLAKGRICPMPFTRKEVKGEGPFVPCCSPWLTHEYYELPVGEDPWNGGQARALRESVLDGSYRYCLRDLCQTEYFAFDELDRLQNPAEDFVFTKANLAALRAGEVRMPDGPTAATVTADPRCNLACGSCRSEAVLRLDPAGEMRVEKAGAELNAMRTSLRRLRIAGDGEPLFSPFLRELIRSLDRSRYPVLDTVELHTNGIFLEEKILEQLKPGSDRINRVYVSVDAGDEETYRRVRGGDWNRLMKNLAWAAEQRRAGRFQSLLLLFVYRAENFRSMRDFCRIGKELGVDGIHFSPLQDWERAGLGYGKTAVHLPTHPEHGEFEAIRKDLAKLQNVTIA